MHENQNIYQLKKYLKRYKYILANLIINYNSIKSYNCHIIKYDS